MRAGFYFAPGYGYYRIPPGYAHRAFVVGVALPPPMRTYVVVKPARYGLVRAPRGYGWYYAGTSFVLASRSTGVIIRTVPGGW